MSAKRMAWKASVGLLFAAIVTMWTQPSECGEASEVDSLLREVRDCMGQTRSQWPEEWKGEYICGIRETVSKYESRADFAHRVDRLRAAFPLYWEGAATGLTVERADFEVSTARIRWHIENLMELELPSPEDLAILKSQLRELLAYAARSLEGQFPFLTSTLTAAAARDFQTELDEVIDSVFSPAFRKPLHDSQVVQIKNQWDRSYRTRSNLWKQMRLSIYTPEGEVPSKESKHGIYYRFARRSLAMVVDQIKLTAVLPPDYPQQMPRGKREATVARARHSSEAMARERRLWPGGRTGLEQVEQWGFALGTLLAATTSAFEETQLLSQGIADPSQATNPTKGGEAK